MQENEDGVIRVQMFGQLQLNCGDHSMTSDYKKSRQLWGLLEYLLANRKRLISMDMLIKILWPDTEISNPMGALKNLIYRLRGLLKEKLGGTEEYILFEKGCYTWNNQLACLIDIEDFEDIWEHIRKGDYTEEEEVTKLRKAISMYKEGFLPCATDKEWVMLLNTYYKKNYLMCAGRLIQLLIKEGRLSEAEEACRQVLLNEPLDEEIHKSLMTVLVAQGQLEKAASHYHLVNELYMRELGVKPSKEFQQIYRKMLRNGGETIANLKRLKDKMTDAGGIKGALWCEYDHFQSYYEFVLREMKRTGETGCLALITIRMMKKASHPSKTAAEFSERMKRLLLDGLRQNDIVSMLNQKQFVVVMTHIQESNVDKVLSRVLADVLNKSTIFAVEIKIEAIGK